MTIWPNAAKPTHRDAFVYIGNSNLLNGFLAMTCISYIVKKVIEQMLCHNVA